MSVVCQHFLVEFSPGPKLVKTIFTSVSQDYVGNCQTMASANNKAMFRSAGPFVPDHPGMQMPVNLGTRNQHF